MQFEWDPEKARINRTKHGVDFSDAIEVLFDPLGLTASDDSAGELRHVTLGNDAFGRLLVVIYVRAHEHVRMISARRATRRERERYQEKP
jgi:uncharacterized DUF497 family protein